MSSSSTLGSTTPGQTLPSLQPDGGLPPLLPLRIAMVAGEPSGDLLASSVLQRLHADLPSGSQFYGIGGPRMLEAGFDTHFEMSTLTVNGYLEVLKHIPDILKIRRGIAHQLMVDPPNVFVGVDAPDFNFALEEELIEEGESAVEIAFGEGVAEIEHDAGARHGDEQPHVIGGNVAALRAEIEIQLFQFVFDGAPLSARKQREDLERLG